MKNFKTKLFAAAIAAPLAMSGMSVFAEGDDEASITVTKDLTAPKGAEKLDATFTMTGTLTKINEQEATDAEKQILRVSLGHSTLQKIRLQKKQIWLQIQR